MFERNPEQRRRAQTGAFERDGGLARIGQLEAPQRRAGAFGVRREHVLAEQRLALPEHALPNVDRAAHDVQHARQRRQRQHAAVGQKVLDEP